MIEVVTSVTDARKRFEEIRRGGATLGLVPTMGALHAGHTSLIERARADNDRVAVSIFVNPTQYDDPADLENYPRTFEADLEKADATGADIVFAPIFADLYPDEYRYRVTEAPLSKSLEGAHRTGHPGPQRGRLRDFQPRRRFRKVRGRVYRQETRRRRGTGGLA